MSTNDERMACVRILSQENNNRSRTSDKDSEVKWVITKGNENLSIIPLSSVGDKRKPMWVADRGSEFRMIRMGLDRVWNVNVSTIGSWIKRLGL